MIRVWLVVAILFGILEARSCLAQSLLFVSPNTREQMSDEMAWNSLQSFEERNFLAVENYLAKKLCTKPQVMSAEGMDGSTTENSSLVTGCGGGRARYLGELLGRYAHQRWILIFDPLPTGHERLLIISFSTDQAKDVPEQLRQQGLKAGTIIAAGGMVRLYLWAKDSSQDAAVNTVVKATNGNVQEVPGKATFIGNDSRSLARKVFDRLIRHYENRHHLSFSKILWSPALHDLGLAGHQ